MPFLSTADLANLLGAKLWRVQRIFETQALPEPPRIAGRRAIPREWLPKVIDALRTRGWLPEVELEEATA